MEGLIGIVILLLDIYAIVQIVGSSSSTAAKIGWSLLVLFLPVVGLIIWAFAGPRSRATATA